MEIAINRVVHELTEGFEHYSSVCYKCCDAIVTFLMFYECVREVVSM